jgi:hypothetical protein
VVKRPGADAFILIGLLALFGVLTYLLSSQQTEGPETRPHYSTYNTRASGYRAAYLLLKQRGVPLGIAQKPLDELPDDAGVLISATPSFTFSLVSRGARWSEEDCEAVLAWVESGGVLVLLHDEAGLLLEKLEVGQGISSNSKVDVPLKPKQPAAFVPGVREVFFPGSSRWVKTPERAVTLFGDTEPTVVAIARGEGVIYAVSNPRIFSNQHLDEADNARFLTQIVEANTAKPYRVYFDEYHQGYETGRTFFDAIGKAGQFTLIQLIVLSVLMAYTAGRRFGLPRPLPPSARVSTEYVQSLANLYQRARARDTVLEIVYLSFWRDLCRTVGMPLDSDTAAVVNAAKGLGDPKNQQEIAVRLEKTLTATEECIALGPTVKEDEMLRLAREIEDRRRELEVGRTDGSR